MKLSAFQRNPYLLSGLATALLLGLTVYCLATIDRAEWQAAWDYQREYAWLFGLAILVNFVGIACDFGAWRLLQGKCGVRLPRRIQAPIFLSMFAGQFLPLQTARLIRPMMVRQYRPEAFGHSAAAEAALFYIDLSTMGAVIGSLVLLLVLPAVALPAGAAFLLMCLVCAPFLFGLAGFLHHAIPAGFWRSKAVFGAAAFRIADALLQGMVLYLLLRPFAPDTGFASSALYALVATTAGAGSGLPGGVGITEGIMGGLVGLTGIATAQVVITVAAYRLVTFYAMVPLGWACLVGVRAWLARHGAPETSERVTPEPAVLVGPEGAAPHA